MKILFLLKSHEYSGAESVILNLMKLLPNEYVTYYASPNGPIRNTVKEEEQNFIALKKANLRNVKKVIRQVNPDIIHASDFSMSVLAAFATSSIPIISHLHNDPIWIKRKLDLRTILYNIALKRILKVVCVSPEIIDEFASKLLRKKAVVIPNFIDRQRIISLANYNSLKSDVCLVGRLTEQKNPLFFCKIISEIKKRQPDVKAIILGRGSMKDKIIEYIKNNNLSNNIKLLGFKVNPYPYMRRTKVCIMPSKFEGFGLSAVEMLTLGIPVIASNVGGLKNIVNESCGSLMNNYDATSYATKYFEIIRNNRTYIRKSKNAVIASEKFTNSQSFRNQFIKIYKEAIKCQH